MSRMLRHTTAVAAACAAGLMTLGACSAQTPSSTPSSSTGTAAAGSGGTTIKFMVTSGSPADVTLQQNVVKPWEDRTGNRVEVVAASDIGKELTQAFASGSPPDLFFTDASVFQSYAKAGNLYPYGDQLEMKSDFFGPLVQTFTRDGKLYCAPKDFSTLALVINPDLWSKAGLATTDVPTTWPQLETVAKKLTGTGVKGLVLGDTINRVGAFMRQAGGWIVTPDQTRMTAATAMNAVGLTEVQKLLQSGSTAYPKAVDAATGSEAFGTGKAAMTIEGPWIKAVLKEKYPTTKWIAVELPAGPASKGTLAFTQCYGIAAKSKNQAAAVDLVKYLSTKDPAMQLAAGLGVMPSISSAKQAYLGQFPSDKAFVDGVTYATLPVTVAGMEPVLATFDTQVAALPGADPEAMLQQLQKDGEAVLTQ